MRNQRVSFTLKFSLHLFLSIPLLVHHSLILPNPCHSSASFSSSPYSSSSSRTSSSSLSSSATKISKYKTGKSGNSQFVTSFVHSSIILESQALSHTNPEIRTIYSYNTRNRPQYSHYLSQTPKTASSQ